MTSYRPEFDPYPGVDPADGMTIGRLRNSAHHGDRRAQATLRQLQPQLDDARKERNTAAGTAPPSPQRPSEVAAQLKAAREHQEN